jgi:hypothetical protein
MRALWERRWWRNNENGAGRSQGTPSAVVSPAQPAYRDVSEAVGGSRDVRDPVESEPESSRSPTSRGNDAPV